MGMVLLVGMSLLVFVWVDLCGRMKKVGWKDRASMRVVIEVQFCLGMHEKHLGVQKERGLLWMRVFFSCGTALAFLFGRVCRFLPFFLFASFLVS